MDRRLRIVLLVARIVVAALVIVGLVLGFGGPARAADLDASRARTLGSGCPIEFSICSPGGVAVLADYALMEAGAAAAAPVAAGTAATTTGSAALSSGISGLAGAAFSLAGVAALDLLVDKDTTTLTVQAGTLHPGWLNDNNVAYYSGYGNVVGIRYDVLQAPAYGAGGTVQVRQTCTYISGNPGYISQSNYSYPFLTNWANVYQNYPNFHRVVCEGGVGNVRIDTTTVANSFAGFAAAGIRWHAVGSPDRPGTTVGGMTGTLRITSNCTGPSGMTPHVTNIAVTGWDGESPVEVPSVQCAPGEVLTYYIVEWVTAGGTQELMEYTAPEWVQDMPVEWPGCVDGGCTVQLWTIPATGAPQWCGAGAQGCPEWWADPTKGEHYQCRYGQYPIDLGYCAIFRQPGYILPNTTQRVAPDGTVTGSPEPVVSTDPADFVTIDEILLDLPEFVAENLPGAGTSGCWPTGWGIFNPVEWVYRPITCALTWAFVPRPEVVQAELEHGGDALASNGVLAVIPAAASVPAAVSEGWSGGCSNDVAVFTFQSQYGPLSGSIPCTYADGAYSAYYAVFTLMLAFSALWSSYVIVRSYFGSQGE